MVQWTNGREGLIIAEMRMDGGAFFVVPFSVAGSHHERHVLGHVLTMLVAVREIRAPMCNIPMPDAAGAGVLSPWSCSSWGILRRLLLYLEADIGDHTAHSQSRWNIVGRRQKRLA